ncbi:MAG: PKD domain-containing protein, partial [Methanosarcinales archaeon]|nr:PKD domain-containing protein [Methanosarcinales archaeon]
GCHWINWTWISGSNSDFVEVKINGVWKENCTNQCYNCTYPPHVTRTISLRGYNSSLNRYSTYLNQTTAIPNHAPVAIPGSVYRHNNVGSTYLCKAIFDASASYDPDGSITNYHWDLGDGTSGTGALVEHIYSSWNWNGTSYDPFIASLTVTDDLDPSINDIISIPVNVYIAGDANGDGVVDIFDATIVGFEWGETCECDTWIDRSDKADLNNDCVIDIFDAVIIGANWEHTAY